MAGSSGIYQSELIDLEDKIKRLRQKWQNNMVKGLNRSLGPPFLPEGFAKAEITFGYCDTKGENPYLILRVGDRDITFDKNGKEVGSGSNVGDAIQWEIHKVKVPYPPIYENEEEE